MRSYLVTMSDEEHKTLKLHAIEKNISMAEIFREMIREYLSEDVKKDEKRLKSVLERF